MMADAMNSTPNNLPFASSQGPGGCNPGVFRQRISIVPLGEDFEMVAGEWIFQYWLEDQLLVEQKFQTYHPAN